MKKILFLLSIAICVSCNKTEKVNKQEESNSTIKSYELVSAKLAAGKLMRVDSFPTKYITPRPVDVWLPESYSNDKKYAVLYMHDGQMLFDPLSTWNKQEWKIDEVATDLMERKVTKDFIVVAVHNIAAIRWFDLFPEKAINYFSKQVLDSIKSIGGKQFENNDLHGDEYLKFIVNDVKPYIDATYSVFTDKANTFIAGSSMGGLMSMYGISEYPNIFEGAACISTHWVGARPQENNPFPDAIFGYVADHVPNAENHKIYFDYGNKTLDQFYPKHAPKVDSIYLNKGYTDKNFKNIFYPDTEHSENSWQERIHIPITFLLGK